MTRKSPNPDTKKPAKVARSLAHAGSAFPVVGIGASAGALEALTQLITALPNDAGMAYIIVQHLEPTHESLLGELLSKHTAMPVAEAVEGAMVARDCIYVIPAGVYLSIGGGTLHLSKPTEAHGARMPVNVLLQSIADDCGERGMAIILSGTGNDGSEGVHAIHTAGGYTIAQDMNEAEYPAMPQNAADSGVIDAVLPIKDMPAALAAFASTGAGKQTAPTRDDDPKPDTTALSKIIALLRETTAHDFSLYKMGTLQRRIERRMALRSLPSDAMGQYFDALKDDADERNLLATDLLINVTSFFRDPAVFALLGDTIVPDIVKRHTGDRPLRIWVAGCSTGEEAYSLAMVFNEAIAAAKRTIQLCVFASDVDADAVATAREGKYPATIAATVSEERLAKFFVKQDDGYTITPDLRGQVVFTIQDLLTDPPFSKLDFVSCRNVLIYLGPEAQAKAIALFHFALQKGGVLLLGTSETIGHADGQFTAIDKSARAYRQIGKSRASAHLFSAGSGDGLRVPPRPHQGEASARQPALADLCRRMVLENFAPAAVLINRRNEWLYAMGPTERYLRVPAGYPTHDVLAMATPALRTKMRAALAKITPKTPHLVTAGGRLKVGARSVPFDLDIRSVMHDGEELLLICFIDRHSEQQKAGATPAADDGQRVADLEHELDLARNDLAAAMHDLEMSDEEHRAVNEEALSVNEEYQSTNEELLTSKEELQSLNEELTALNGQLQETLERQRTMSNDLQNVLYSSDVATLFLDTDLKIRFFTPATKALFNLIPGDIGRPLSDLQALSADPALTDDARQVLNDSQAITCEVEVPGGVWFMRHILPYRTDGDGVEGVVITFTDVTEKKKAREALEVAKREAEQANLAKSRFLAAASHDLRQPLQSLALLQGLLATKVTDAAAQGLLGRLEQTLNTMSGMLNTMLDINQIEAGIVRAEPIDFIVGDLIDQVRGEFVEQARAQHLDLRAVHSARVLHSDPVMISQMLRNLVSNALKYTKRGKILVGCRMRGSVVRIEVWDTGVGIAVSQLDAIFDEYHQIDNAARERSLGLGLGLSIVQRLGALLGHTVGVRSLPSRGSVFSIDIEVAATAPKLALQKSTTLPVTSDSDLLSGAGHILIVEDDPELRDLLDHLLTDEGYNTATAADGASALAIVKAKSMRPDLLLADYNLPGGMTGLQLAKEMREAKGRAFPVIILTGDISTTTLRDVSEGCCLQLNKPVRRDALLRAIRALLTPKQMPPAANADGAAIVYIVDDDDAVRQSLREVVEADGRVVQDFADSESFLAAYHPGGDACLLLDAHLPHMDGIGLLHAMKSAGHHLPAIMITGNGAVPMAVEAMTFGAIDFLEKPVGALDVLDSIDRALSLSRDTSKRLDWKRDAVLHLKSLTPRQKEIMDLVLAGHPSKNIAADLNISQRTVENHRASIMKKTGAKSLPALARLALGAAEEALL